MSNTLDGDEVHAIILLVISGDLVAVNSIFGLPLSPRLGHRPVEVLDPLLGSISANCTISVS